MEIRYIRKLMTSHMVIAQIECLSEWEEKMISYASLPGVLFADCICEDGNSNLWYDITGKQSLDVILEGRSLGYDLLCHILMGIYEAVEGLEGILLKAENILLLPECIFLDYEMEQVYVCYYPHNTMQTEDSFLQLMEYLLKKLVHEDQKAVELAYGIYEQAAQNEWSLHELKRSILLTYQIEEVSDEIMPEVEKPNVIGIRTVDTMDEQSAELPVEEALHEDTFWQRCMRQMRSILHEWSPIDKLPIEKLKLEKRQQRKSCVKKATLEEEERFVFEPEEEIEKPSRPTVLLAQLNKPIEGILRYEGTGHCENLVIEGEEYLIGSDPSCAGHIPSETVSRKHAKITRIGEVYMLEDLNSSNGTYAGGDLLNYKTKVSLQKNEVVIFADEKFRFI